MRGINQTIEGFYFHEVMPKPGVMGFLERIKKAEIPMCIATASERSHIEAALRRCGMDHYFDAVFTCGEVGHGKDEPVIFRKAVAYFDAEPSMTLVFEDALHAARTAKQDGFVVVGVFDPSEPAQDEFRKHCDFYLFDFSTEPEGSPLWK